MTTTQSRPGSALAPVGDLLREWRAARRFSQLDLANDAQMSTRHLSYIENGRSQPSREAVDRLADALDMPLRERNALLVAAGYAPAYPETALAVPELSRVSAAIRFILDQQEPYPAFLMNRHWDVLMVNRAAERVFGLMLDGQASQHTNMLRQIFDPSDLRAAIANWEEVAGDLIRDLHNLVAAVPTDLTARALLDEVLAYPGVPDDWRTREPGASPSPLLTTVMRRGSVELQFFSTITTFGTPRDVTLDELHIECCFPVDDATTVLCEQLRRDDDANDRLSGA